MDRDRTLLDLATRQHGLITSADLARLGLGRSFAHRRVSTGRWERMAPGVWRIAGTPPTWFQHLHAGLAWLGDQAVVSGFAAAQLWGFDGFASNAVEFVTPRVGRTWTGPYVVHSTKDLRPIDRATHHGLRVTSGSRTVIDLAARDIDPELLGNAIDSAVRDLRSAPAFLRRRIQALRGSGRHGVRLLDELMLDAGGHSWLERRFLRLMREHGLPRPDCQVVHRRDGRTIARVDFEFRPNLLIVEVSGRRGHVTEADRRRDAQRRNELQHEGYMVLEFLTSDVVGSPEEVVDSVRRGLAATGAS